MATTPYGNLTSVAVPEQFGGKTLKQLQGEGQQLGRSDLVANLLGISENTPLVAGQAYDLSGLDLGSQEGAYLKSSFKQADAPEVRAMQPAIQTLQQSGQQAQSTIQSGQQSLKDRYNTLLDSILKSKEGAVKNAQISAAREFGRRGIPTSSTAYDQYLQGQVLPVETQYGQLAAETGLAGEQANQNILNAIAQIQQAQGQGISSLQAGGGQSAIANTLALYQQQQDRAAQEQQLQAQLENAYKIAQLQNQPQAETYKPSLTNVGGVGYYWDPATQSFKSVGGGGGGGQNSLESLAAQFGLG